MQFFPGDPGDVIFKGPFEQPSRKREVAEKCWLKPGARKPVQKGHGQVRVNGEEPRRRLAVYFSADAQHLAGKLKLVFFAAHVLNHGVGESQIHRLVGKGQAQS